MLAPGFFASGGRLRWRGSIRPCSAWSQRTCAATGWKSVLQKTISAIRAETCGNTEDPEHLTSRDRGLGLRQIEGPRRHVCGLMGVERLDDGPADLGTVVIDDSDRDVANELPDVRLRIEDRIEERSHDDETEGAGVPQHAAVLVAEGAGDADAPRKSGWRKRLWPRRRVAKNAPRPEPGKAEQDHRQSAEPSEGFDRVVGGHTAGRLIEQDLDVPAKRQQRTPHLPERSHGEGGEADAGKAEGG